MGFWSSHKRGGVIRKFKTISLFCSAVDDVPARHVLCHQAPTYRKFVRSKTVFFRMQM